jgi:hypothetical protein
MSEAKLRLLGSTAPQRGQRAHAKQQIRKEPSLRALPDGRARDCCHSRFALIVIPIRRDDSHTTVGPSGPARMRRAVRGEMPLSAAHSRTVMQWSSDSLSDSGSGSGGGFLPPGFFMIDLVLFVVVSAVAVVIDVIALVTWVKERWR